jgi:hypothetical protein
MYEHSEKAIKRKSRPQAAMAETIYLKLKKKKQPTENKVVTET